MSIVKRIKTNFKKAPFAYTVIGGLAVGIVFYPDTLRRVFSLHNKATNVGSGLGKAGMLGDEDDVASGHGFQQTGYTGKHAFGVKEPIHPMPSGPKISYRAEDHEQPMMMDPIYEAAKRPRDASMFQPASVRNMNMEATVAQGFESTVFAGIDNVNMF